MHTFQYIFINLLNKYKYTNNNNILLFNLFFTFKLIKSFESKKKFKFLSDYIINNKLLNLKEKNKIFNLFFLSQKYYFSLSRFSYKLKIKQSKLYDNIYDLNFNLLDNINAKNKINILENKLIFTFRLTDIINIINSSLCYMDNFNFKIKDIKNPYTNNIFNISTLYNIYFAVKKTTFIMPKFLHLFFLSNFDKNNFFKYNESLIKNHVLNNYVLNLNKEEKFQIIINLINEFQESISISFISQTNNEIYKNNLINLFNGCIKDFIYIKYSNNILLIENAKENLFKQFIFLSNKHFLNNLKFVIYDNLSFNIQNYNKYTNIINKYLYNSLINSIFKHSLIYSSIYLFCLILRLFLSIKFIYFLYNEVKIKILLN